MNSKVALALLLLLPAAEGSAMSGMAMYGNYPMFREASGTSWQPDAAAHEGRHYMRGEWMGMLHGYADAVFDRQGGPRGGTQGFSSSMLMATAVRALGPGRLGLRGMASLDPAMGPRGYRLLLQTGETADGKTPLIDRQHPHDLLAELAAAYTVPFGDGSVFLYLGLPGEPALGPPAFIHRSSGLENPEAPISHHWMDSTHITEGVATLGVIWLGFKAEGSAFRGREPDQRRWDIEKPRLDSCSGRLSLNPDSPNWSLQVSHGFIKEPEKLAPGVDVHRTTASAIYHRRFQASTFQGTLAVGRNQSLGEHSDAVLAEGALRWDEVHTAFARAERVEKDELFVSGPNAGRLLTVGKLTAGYVRDVATRRGLTVGVGGSLSAYALPAAARSAYGGFPLSFMVWVRVKIA